jgi:hypothetical protein
MRKISLKQMKNLINTNTEFQKKKKKNLEKLMLNLKFIETVTNLNLFKSLK